MSAGSGSTPARACRRVELPVTAWSEHWLAYSPYDAVLLTASELRSAPPGVVSALWQYAEAGGNLFVVGPIEPPAPWQTRRPIPGANAVEYQVGFGRCVVLNSGRLPERYDTAEGVALRERILNLAEAWASVQSATARTERFAW